VTRAPLDGFALLGAKPTRSGRWWRYLCPACCEATVAIVPHGQGWRLAAEIGCSRGCSEAAIRFWQAWRCGEIPPEAPADERAQRYAGGAVRRILAELPGRPTAAELAHAAFRCGQFVEAGKLDPEPIVAALTDEAVRAGVELEPVASAMATGTTRPARLP
jgi:hypothetical protein